MTFKDIKKGDTVYRVFEKWPSMEAAVQIFFVECVEAGRDAIMLTLSGNMLTFSGEEGIGKYTIRVQGKELDGGIVAQYNDFWANDAIKPPPFSYFTLDESLIPEAIVKLKCKKFEAKNKHCRRLWEKARNCKMSCKVGDTLYFIRTLSSGNSYAIPVTLNRIRYYESGVVFSLTVEKENDTTILGDEPAQYTRLATYKNITEQFARCSNIFISDDPAYLTSDEKLIPKLMAKSKLLHVALSNSKARHKFRDKINKIYE